MGLSLRLLPAPRRSKLAEGEVSACSYTPDGKFALTGEWDGHLRLWEASSGSLAAALRVGTKPVSACAVSADGKEFLAGTLDGILTRWDALTHHRLSIYLAHPRPISAIVFSRDGRTLATASWDRNVTLWDVGREREGRTLGGHADIVAGCRFTPDGRTLVSWSHDGTVRFWDVAHGRQTASFAAHTDRVLAGAVSPDGRWAASGSRDGMVKLWDLGERREAGLAIVEAEIRGLFFLLDAASLIAVDTAGWLRVFALPDLEEVTTLDTHLPIQCADLASTGDRLAVGCLDGRVRFVAVDGFDSTPLVVLATQVSRRTATAMQRLFGRSQLVHSYLCTCPACRNSFELPTTTDPGQQAPCPRCRRQLRVSGVLPLVPAT
jgi:hypothetical protein